MSEKSLRQFDLFSQTIKSEADASPLEQKPTSLKKNTPTKSSKAPAKKKQMAPMLQHYLDVKQQFPDYILLFQVGDFFEVFFEDAVSVSQALSIRLTSRDKENEVPMCGVPIHACNTYLPKLIAAGFSCVVVEQVEDAGASKGLVKRDITRIVTPGVRLDTDGLDEFSSSFCLSVVVNDDATLGASCMEVSTGKLYSFHLSSYGALEDLISCYEPSEMLLHTSVDEKSPLYEPLLRLADLHNVKISHWESVEKFNAQQNIIGNALNKSEVESILGAESASSRSLELLLTYVLHVLRVPKILVSECKKYTTRETFVLDAASRKNLEVSHSSYEGDKRYSLLGVIDKAKTAMGSRKLRDWVQSPSSNASVIVDRLDAVEECINNSETVSAVRESLSQVRDIERLLTRLNSGRITPYDLGLLLRTLEVVPAIRFSLQTFSSSLIQEVLSTLDPLEDLTLELQNALLEDLPPRLGEADVIRSSYSSELEELRGFRSNAQGMISDLEQREKQRSGISSLKIKHNSVFGYYIEVTKVHADKVPADYIRKQTLTNAERFFTEELKELEKNLLSASGKILQLETDLFVSLKTLVVKALDRLQGTAESLATIDTLTTFAHVSRMYNLVRPDICEEPVLQIDGGRHLVVESVIGENNFIENDVSLGEEEGLFAILTGPNMGGKSTYLKQIGLIQILAQAGCFVPARTAKIGIADRIFTRIGAGDNVAGGESTFMVEMREASRILQAATANSLILIDELGRGTATADGYSLAQSISEWLIQKTRARTVFATHFHGLVEMRTSYDTVKCLAVGIIETSEGLQFTHRIEEVVSDKSYGIHVAELAGIPSEVVNRARVLLEGLESDTTNAPSSGVKERVVEKIVVKEKDSKALQEMIEVVSSNNPDEISPRDAHEALYTLSKLIDKIQK